MFESFNSRLKPVGLSCGLLCPRALVMPALCYPFFTISLFVQINSKHCVTHFSWRGFSMDPLDQWLLQSGFENALFPRKDLHVNF